MKHYFQWTEPGGFNVTFKEPKPKIEIEGDVDFILLDLFCGAGGTTSGFDKAMINGKKCAIIMACINHDANAIISHWANHPEVEHYEEDITTMYGMVWKGVLFQSREMLRLKRLIDLYRALYPKAKFILWASLECTNFSKAKGGLPRDADSRTLADHLDRYIQALQPDYIQIENVVEFMSWGPLTGKVVKSEEGYPCCMVDFVPVMKKDESVPMTWVFNEQDQDAYPVDNRPEIISHYRSQWYGVPESTKSGKDYLRWCKHIDELGYSNQWKELNSADFGAYTSRNRLFGCFAKPGMPMAWPAATHAKKVINSGEGLFGPSLLKWKPVKDVLDFEDEGISIFNRKKPLSEKTLERIYAGMVKYVAGGKEKNDAFMQQLYAADSKGTNNYSVENAARTITTRDGTAIVRTCFLSGYNSGKPETRNTDIEVPCKTLLTSNTYALINCSAFVAKYYSGKPEDMVSDISSPMGTLRTKDGQALVQCFLTKNFSGKPEGKSIPVTGPAGTITTFGGGNLVQCFLTKYYSTGGQLNSIDEPGATLGTKDTICKIWLDKCYTGKENHQSVNQPAGALTANPHYALMHATSFIDRNFTTGGQNSSVEEPAGSILSVPKLNVVNMQPFIVNQNHDRIGSSIDDPCPTLLASRKHYYLLNLSHGGHSTDIDKPCPVIIARQDKAPLYLMYLEEADVCMAIPVYEDEPAIMVKIKEFMWLYKITDIKMRMLKVSELKLIQGFDPDYYLHGNQSDQKKFIGNSVHPLVPKYWSETLARKLRQLSNLN
jgi:DNA (cytosine-5)-methyltransferase 1